MKLSNLDLHLVSDEETEVNDDRVAVACPKKLKQAYYKLPKKARNRRLREFIAALVKENAS